MKMKRTKVPVPDFDATKPAKWEGPEENKPLIVKYRDKLGRTKYREVRGKAKLWLINYLDLDGPGFMNVKESARLAGYSCSDEKAYGIVGNDCKKRMMPIIECWLEECGLGPVELKRKMVELLHAKRVKYFANEGVVTDEREEKALDVQLRTLELAMKVTGVLKDERGAARVDITASKGKLTIDVNKLSDTALVELQQASGEGGNGGGEWEDVDWDTVVGEDELIGGKEFVGEEEDFVTES